MRRNQEEIRQLKSVRESKVYTVRNHTLESITCDDNGVYASSNQNNRTFDAEISNHSTVTVRTCHKEDGIFHYKEKTGQGYTKCPVEQEDVFELEKYCRWNKTFTQLKRMVYRIKSVSKPDYEPYICPVYSINSDSYSKIVHDREVREHGNSKQKQPYHRTDPTILKRQDMLLSANKPLQEVYDLLLDESGGPIQSNSMSQEPRNLKQIRNRQSVIGKALQSTNKTIPQQANDYLHTLLWAQRDSVSFLKTVKEIHQSFIAFAYTEKQLSDIEKFCCKSMEARVFAVDTTCNLCNLWITDTSYRNKRLVNTIDRGAPVHLNPIMLHFTKHEKTFARFGLEILSANPNLKNISFIGVDLESAIFTGLETMIPGLRRLICVRHLMKQDESKVGDLPKTGQNIADRKLSLSEIIKDIYGSRVANFY